MKLHPTLLAGSTALVLSACGGLSDEAPLPTVPNEVPASATASPTAYTQYAASLTASETAEPVGVNLVLTPPTTETAEPLTL